MFKHNAIDPSEDTIQSSVVAQVRTKYPSVIIYSIPNGGSRNIAEAVKLKRTGTLAGIPDLFIAEPRKGYGGLYLEIKKKGKKPTKVQIEKMGELTRKGYRVAWKDKIDDAMAFIDEYLMNK